MSKCSCTNHLVLSSVDDDDDGDDGDGDGEDHYEDDQKDEEEELFSLQVSLQSPCTFSLNQCIGATSQ